MGVERVAVLGPGPHHHDPDDRGEDADGGDDEREQHGRGRVVADGPEGREAQDERGDDGDLVGLEEVGRHARAVTDVVADVVGDGGRVAGIVLGDPGFHLAHQIGPHVGGLGEDAAADPHEQGDQRGAEGETDQHCRGRVLEDEHDGGGTGQAQADAEHAGHGAGAEGHPQRAGHAPTLRGGGGGADIAPHGDAHADEAGQAGKGRAEEEADDAVEAVLGEGERQHGVPVADDRHAVRAQLHDLGGGEEHQDGQRDHDDGDGPELPAQEGLGPLLDGQGDLLHLGRALVIRQDVAGQEESGHDAHQAGRQADVQPDFVRSAELEILVSTLGGEEVDHAWCAFLVLSVFSGSAVEGRGNPARQH